MSVRRQHARRGPAPVWALVALATPLALTAPAALSACGGDDDDGAAPGGAQGATPPVVDEIAVIYQGGPTDETLRSVIGVPPLADDARAATLAAPAAGATMSAATPPTFQWAAAQALAPASPASRSPWARLVSALGEPAAHAHGKPYSGVAYLLSIASASGTPLLTVLTAETSFTPDAAEWATVSAGGDDLRVYLLTARCEQNAVVAGGPWAPSAGAVALRLGP